MKHTSSGSGPIIVECDLPQSPDVVWRALTERELLGAWLLPNDLRPERGARFSFNAAGGLCGASESIDCEILEAQPNRTLRWRQTEEGTAESGWHDVTSIVSIELTDTADGGTHLRLEHGEFSLVPMAAANDSDLVCMLRRAA